VEYAGGEAGEEAPRDVTDWDAHHAGPIPFRLEHQQRMPRPCPCVLCRDRGCPELVERGGELDFASSTHGDQNPRPVAKDATRAGHPRGLR
jgi:hypothetical protein